MIIHVVKQGDNLDTIAKMYNTSVQQLEEDNAIVNTQRLMIGQAIVVRKNNAVHIVSAGQSLYEIAELYNTNVPRLIAINPQITDPGKIEVSQAIIIPSISTNYGTIEVNGYSYPNIDTSVLQKSLPHLTYYSIFSYQVHPDGSLTTIKDDSLVTLAKDNDVLPMMVITNINEAGEFDSDLVHTILSDKELQAILLKNITATLKNKYGGLAVDFEYIRPIDKEAYNDFLKTVVATLHPLGYIVSTAVAPKLSGQQKGLLYEAHDYPEHGVIVDHVIIMTYEWGYTYGPAQAVAPLDQVSKVIQYAVSVIPNKKILMGIPNYGYDWTLPFKKGSSATALSNTGAIELASEVGAEIQYDEKAQAPFFTYYDKNKKEHIVWFEDARSIQAKLELVDKYNLGGVSFWTLTSYFPQAWVVLESMFQVKKLPSKK